MVDEVLAVGDPEVSEEMFGEDARSRTLRRTVLFVSHNVAALESLMRSGAY